MSTFSWRLLMVGLACLGASAARAQEAFRLRESFPAGYAYHVSSRVEVSGTLSLPPEKKQAARSLPLTGKSALNYEERLLTVGPDGQVQKTIRLYRRMDFERKVGPQQ